MFPYALMGIPKDPDMMVRALPVMTHDLDVAIDVGRKMVVQDPEYIGFVVLDRDDTEVARWMAPE
jgi:hypothetical protein